MHKLAIKSKRNKHPRDFSWLFTCIRFELICWKLSLNFHLMLWDLTCTSPRYGKKLLFFLKVQVFFYILNFHVILFHSYNSTPSICSRSLIWYLGTNLFLLSSLLYVILSWWYNTMRIFSERKKFFFLVPNRKLIQCEEFYKLFVILMACLVLSVPLVCGWMEIFTPDVGGCFSSLSFLSAFLIHTITAMSLNLIKIIAIWKAVLNMFFLCMDRFCVWNSNWFIWNEIWWFLCWKDFWNEVMRLFLALKVILTRIRI